MNRVNWIMTVNDIDLVPAPLRDRARVFHLAGLQAENAIGHFDRLTASCDTTAERDQCRAFILRMADGPRGISLRQIKQLADVLMAPIALPSN
ncbi:hypothetical protein [Puniceibacterium sp. IMCC21224]|uniref:hypothetical protein n=1 Tax=Puniceibacterium sp. IMCC21224 TaxID=1618204 RepID=UPI00064D8CEA|nr:hypothetical protein [Puniceibacterium sp. IMCC21224]KMK67571.1 hypothetical protein IMCC21224_112442 [Puniceibacterium sp. IMCC21224]